MKKKSPESPQIMKRSSRGVMDKALSGAVNAGEGAEDALKRLYGIKALSSMSDNQVYNLHDKAGELAGHLGLEKYGISDADPQAVKKLLSKEYGYLTDVVPSVITDSNDANFRKKFEQALKLGHVEPELLSEIASGETLGSVYPAVHENKIIGPKSIIVAPGENQLRRAGVGMHEAQHGVDQVMGQKGVPQDFDLANIRKNSDDPFEALRSMSKGHHVGQDHFELDKANQIIKGGRDFDDNIEKQIRKKALEGLTSRFGEGFKKVRSVVGPMIGPAATIGGVIAAGSAEDALADAFVPGGVEAIGKGSDEIPQDDTQQIKTYSESATDPNVRRMAIQELRSRLR